MLLAIFLGAWTWVYTYREDGSKFWSIVGFSIVGTLLTVALPAWIIVQLLVGLGVYIYGIVTAATRSDEWYTSYGRDGGQVAIPRAA